MLPPAREHNFYKTRIFDFIAKMGSKILVFQAQIPLKIEENRRQKRSLQTRPFVTPFLFIFDCILASNLRFKKRIFLIFFQHGLKRHPRGSKRSSRADFKSFWASFWKVRWAQGAPKRLPRGSKRVTSVPRSDPREDFEGV